MTLNDYNRMAAAFAAKQPGPKAGMDLFDSIFMGTESPQARTDFDINSANGAAFMRSLSPAQRAEYQQLAQADMQSGFGGAMRKYVKPLAKIGAFAPLAIGGAGAAGLLNGTALGGAAGFGGGAGGVGAGSALGGAEAGLGYGGYGGAGGTVAGQGGATGASVGATGASGAAGLGASGLGGAGALGGAMNWADFIGPATSIGGAIIGSNAAGNAADSQAAATNAAIAEQRRQFDLTRGDFAPYRQTGVNALSQLAGDINRMPTAEEVMAEPGYQFGADQGQRAIDNKISAMGGRVSGQAIKAAGRFGNDYASGQYGAAYQRRQDRLNRLASLAGIGQTSTGASAAAGQNSANNISGLVSSQGDATGAGQMAQGSIWQNAINSAGAGLSDYYSNRRKPSTPGKSDPWAYWE